MKKDENAKSSLDRYNEIQNRLNASKMDLKRKSNLEKTSAKDFRLDHNNTPYRWKDQSKKLDEKTASIRKNKLLRQPQPVREFPTPKISLKNSNSVPMMYDTAAPVAPQQDSEKAILKDNAMDRFDNTDFLQIDESKLPLEEFDNAEYEMHSSDEWMKLSKRGKIKYYINGEWKWKPCSVQSYDSNTKLYTVEVDVIEKVKQVKRINLCFDEEDDQVFFNRVEAAIDARNKAKARMRYDYFIEQQSSTTISPMTTNTWDGIQFKVKLGFPKDKSLQDEELLEQSLANLNEDVQQEYIRNMKKAVVWHQLKHDPKLDAYYKSLRLIDIPQAEIAPMYAKIKIPAHSYVKHKHVLTDAHFSKNGALLDIMVKLYTTWDASFKHVMYGDTEIKAVTLPCELKQFQSSTMIAKDKAESTLLQDWRRAIIDNIIDGLQDTFDWFQSDEAVFRESYLHQLFKSIAIRMSAQLWQVVQTTIHSWKAFVIQYTQDMDEDEFIIQTSLFATQLTTEENTVVMRPSPKELSEAMIAPLRLMVSSIRSIHTIESNVMAMMHLTPVNLFNLLSNDVRVEELDQLLEQTITFIENQVATALQPVEQLALLYQEYIYLKEIDIEAFVEKLSSENTSIEKYCEHIRNFHDIQETITTMSFNEEIFSLATVNTVEIKQTLQSRALLIRDTIIENLVCTARKDNLAITSRYEATLNRINEKPSNEAELAALKAFVAETKSIIDEITKQVDDTHKRLDAISEFNYKISDTDFMLAWSTKQWPMKVQHAANSCDAALEDDKIRMINKLMLEKQTFEVDVERYEEEVAAFKLYENIDFTEKYVEIAINVHESLAEAKQRAEDFNARDAVFGFAPTEYSILDSLQETFSPYYSLWTMCSDFNINKQAWLNGAFLELQGNEIEQKVTEWWKSSYKLSKSLANEAPDSAEVALELRERTSKFRAYLPMIQSLASPALNARHWNQLGDKIGESIEKDDDELTLQHLLDTGMTNHIDDIQQVCAVAEKEYSLEKSLKAMMAEWEFVEIECAPYRESGTYLIRSVEDIISLLDDHIVKTQTMRGSPYIKPNEKECRGWEKKLQYAQQLIDSWMNCQRTWMYLEPIFGSEDIMRQMPAEARKFASVDALWRKTLEDTVADPIFLNVIGLDKLLQKFQKANEKLDEIQKGLNDYLEMKRLYFPRFFFLSNDELLEILSQTKEPRAVQPHLGKCFEGVNTVTFTDTLCITEMISAQGEKVQLKTIIDPEKGKNKGNVEMWLLELEQSQWESVHDHTLRAMETYPHSVREEWVLKWPAQVVLAASQVYWTQDVTRAIQESGTKGLAEYVKSLNKQLELIVHLVRGNLTKLERSTIGALVVIDVHARDTLQHMIVVGVENDQDFEWISQFRYYSVLLENKSVNDIQARIVNARINYGYEYLGNTMRLVITPLTDRCYRTMMGAVDLMYGGAPEGPAGTGKTETVKDLSKAVAIQCVVFNCSDGLDYLAMAKFFKGLAGCGSWCCFDEFNRINIEVLSVIAQQILTINEGKKAKVDKFLFEGTYIKLNPSANVFITMNPGYAGRAELPDNLKALFRPCAMMVPDYALIAEIRLYSFGFSDARSNARKLTQVLQLSSEQLSSQKHYDYGMRAVNSILVAAGNLRQVLGGDESWTEDKIVLRSVQDVNLPKFTTDDLPLFQGITSDLFPNAIIPSPDHGPLIPAIEQICKDGITIVPETNEKLECIDQFKKKVVQLYETVLVRHGLMVVGQTGSGKSCIVHTLASALSKVNDTHPELQSKVQVFTINPKSITSGQLYGNFDENTHEWSDGVLACTYRNCARDTSDDRKWVMFDGPVDAVWIENMNTVLDDNKKLCLMSGEIVKMTDKMTMMFEAEDLEEASPATVSRVGMVFLEPKNLGWRPLFVSWLDHKVPTTLKESFGESLSYMMEWLLPPTLFYVEKYCTFPTPVTTLELVAAFLRLLGCMLVFEDVEYTKENIECLFIKSIVWSLGACIDDASRFKFDEFVRSLAIGEISPLNDEAFSEFVMKNRGYVLQEGSIANPPPTDGIVYDYSYDLSSNSWKSWIDTVERETIPRESMFTSILVPTVDTIRNSWILDILIMNNHHVLCTGDTGTGKSVSVKRKLLTELGDEFSTIFMSFSAQTSANQSQDIIESKLDKRRKGVLGPPVGKQCIIFVDDLNMPAKETYGAQPPIELLRQFMGHGGWYNRKENTFTQLANVQFVAAMGPPGGGRTQITQRYVRYFNVLNFVPFNGASLQLIFETISDWFLAPFSAGVKAMTQPMVSATIGIYDIISATLLPTPAKSHYTFNLRDLSKVFQGVATGNPSIVKSGNDLIRLWSHECLRVFYDRLIDTKDRDWFQSLLSEVVSKNFNLDYAKDVKGKNDTLIYANFATGDSSNAANGYREMEDREQLQNMMETSLDDYNNMNSAIMSLVLFQNAIQHIARISRVIQQPYGNALLVGVGGSGRKSLTALAVFMADYKLFQIEISKSYCRNDWREDIKKVFQLAGVSNQPTVFLFSDTQIVEEAYLEDINGILNTGEVANLWNNEELMIMNEALEKSATAAGINAGSATEVYSFFVDRCRTNLHVVLALSPIGDAFRRRLRMFPSLVNCCTIDWFTEWPDEALRSVANHFLVDIELNREVKEGIVDVCVQMQKSVSELTADFLQSLRRHYYVTPTSYLELISTFKKLFSNKRTSVKNMKERYDNGLTKLVETAADVAQMQLDLEALQPQLKTATIETDALLVTIAREQKEANTTKEVVGAEEKVCNEQAAAANEIKSSCEAELAEAIPALENAVKALRTLTKGDITEVKAMKKPPDGVKLVMETVCILMGVSAIKVKDPNGGTKKVDDYWGPAQKHLLSDTKFLQNLMDFDKDNISEAAVVKVKPYTDKADFTPEKIKKASVAASGLCSWVHAMIVYDRVSKVVAPKRAALKEATDALEAAQADLKIKQDALQEILDKVAKLQSDLDDANKKKSDLQNQVNDCSAKLTRANQLIGGLGGEKVRWQEMSVQLQEVYDNVVGDIMLSSGIIAYLGSFTSAYRDTAITQWSERLRAKTITCSSTFRLADSLGDPVKIRAWTIARLPNDSFSIDNAIMLSESNRWPLMIDPQGQANRWVKNMEADNDLRCIKQSQATFVRTLENSISFGNPVLLENVSEDLDPILEPVLLKQITKLGSVLSIRLGDNTVEYDSKFRLYLTTTLRNPHYPPETCVKVNLLNFMATEEGLQDQMLGIVVAKEEPVLEAQREKLVLEDAENKKILKEIEDKILHLLQTVEGNILDDETLIETLGASKVTANKIEEKVREAAKTQEMIAEKRKGYTPVAFRSSQLFFCISDLAGIDPMYQYALDWFIALFISSIEKAEKSDDLAERMDNLNNNFTITLYVNVCRSLFEKDKLLFSFLLALKILVGAGTVIPIELRYFLSGNTAMELAEPNPSSAWLPDPVWGDLLGLNALPNFAGFTAKFVQEISTWEKCFNSSDPYDHFDQIECLDDYDQFQKMIVLRCFRPDKVIPAVMNFVSSSIGKQFIEPQPFNLMAGYEDSNSCTPLIFVLTPGADPMSELLKLANELGFGKKFVAISLGQGQGPLAENAVAEAIDNGSWVCLQNCHLSVSWLPTLERLCEELSPDRVHTNFRLWLTSEPCPQFPSYILQHGVKMTNEPPKGMRANLRGSYTSFDSSWIDSSLRPTEFKKLLFGLCFFHATVRERTKFGPLGWNIQYVFSGSDLNISRDQLKIFLDELGPKDPVPYEALAYLAGECNYGGRVTDDKDRRCIVNILTTFYTAKICDDKYHFSPSGIYYAPKEGNLDSYLKYISSLPMNEEPEIFGLHDNANISCAISETNLLIDTALSLQPRNGGGAGKSWDDILGEAAADISSKLPECFDLEKADLDFPVEYTESMNTVLTQELIRFNRLIFVIRKSLNEVQRALKGLVVMSGDLEAMGNSMVNGQVPEMWSAVAYPSLKPLGSWVTDFLTRLTFLQDWIDRGSAPVVYWISGFFFTQAFITGTLQNFARKHTLPIDQVGYDMQVFSHEASSKITSKAEDGAYIEGLFMEGARWEDSTMCIEESHPRILHVAMPTILLLPKHQDNIELVEDSHPRGTAHCYMCPVYKTSLRQGTLSTTGHSTNFVMYIRIPIAKRHNQKHWILRGVAMLTQLDT